MLIHANKRWPDAVTTNLWPYAIRMANDSINATPWPSDPQKRSPIELFTATRVADNPKHWHHFGCPVYVLDDEVQQNRRPKGGKWAERARIGLYLGRSPQHSRNVALVLNIQTARVSPQFHIKVDSMFHTTRNTTRQERTKSTWQEAAGFISDHSTRAKEKDQDKTEPKTSPPPVEFKRMHPPEGASEALPQGSPTPPEEAADADPGSTNATEAQCEIFSLPAMFPVPNEDLLAMKASSDPDTMYLHEAMKQPDREEFMKAMRKEIDAQLDTKTLVLRHISEVPKGATVLPAVWQMKRKRHILTREVYKWKARLNIDGSKMVYKRDYDQTYAPVVSWYAIRLLLVLTIIHGWHTVQLDYVLAFTQAPVDRDLYMHIPKGFQIDGAKKGEYVLQVKRNVYGQKQAGRVWNKYLVKGLKELGFTQSSVDESVFFKGRMIYILYTDDSILAGPDKSEINRTISEMKRKFNMTEEGSLEDFLGINIKRNTDGSIHLSQPHLIDQILQQLHFRESTKEKETPMKSSTLLSRHNESADFDGSFNYRSLIGKLNYLERGTRPDISYAVHQCARFSNDPKKEHGDAIRWIARYLKGTRDKGMILKPDLSKSFEVFVDADFSGNWDRKIASEDPDTARSRHGYIITYAGCPIMWKSQLQTEIALSSTESEYTGLSYALREAIPIMELLK